MSVNTKHTPPKWALRFFRWFCREDIREDIEGDLLEMFDRKLQEHSPRKARWLFVRDVFKLFRPGLIRRGDPIVHLTPFGMYRNYFLTALRNIRKEKAFTIMNVSGLALGIGCALTIYLIVQYESGYDQYHAKADSIYRIINEYHDPARGTVYGEGQVHPMGEALRNEFQGLDAVMTYYAGEGQITIENKNGTADQYRETKGIAYAEPGLFRIFDFKFVAGDPEKALIAPGSVVITKTLALKYFKLSPTSVHEAIGKTLMINNQVAAQVTAVMEDTHANTDIPFALIGNYKDQVASNPYFNNGTDWHEYNSSTHCYIALSKNTAPGRLEKQLTNFAVKYSGKESASHFNYRLQPLSELHSSDRGNNYNRHAVSTSMLIALSIIGAFLVVTACINFVNLSTAQAIRRSKEIGIRKTVGGTRKQLVFQYLGETVLISFIAAFGGILVAEGLFIYLKDILGYTLQLDLISTPMTFVFLSAMVLVIGLFSGLYPSIVMARMNTVLALKNSPGTNGTSGLLSLRRSLVVAQFAISQVLIIGTIVVHMQMDFFLNTDLGFDKEAVIVTKLPDAADSSRRELFRHGLMKHPSIQMMSYNASAPVSSWRVGNPINYPTLEKDTHDGNLKTADENYIGLFKLKLIAGRNLPPEKSYTNAIVNRKVTALFGFSKPEDALGVKFKYASGLEFTIIGVVEDFHTASLKGDLENVILANVPFNIREADIKLSLPHATHADIQNTLDVIKTEWTKVFPEYVFDYSFYDQDLGKLYSEEERTASLIQLFAFIAIFIGCLGLYALIAYVANQKTKEIGVRKVLGATAFDIQRIFSNEMLVMIFTAFAIAAPVGYYVMQSWLEGFTYRINFSPLVFIMALLASLVIACITIFYKTVSASLINPVNALKTND